MGVAYLFYKGVKKIPSACITVEDTEMMARMAARGTKIVINLKMEAKMLPPAVSRNTIAEVKGSVYPEQVFHFLLQLIRNVVKSAGRNAHLQARNQDFMGGGGVLTRPNKDPTTEMYFLFSDPFI